MVNNFESINKLLIMIFLIFCENIIKKKFTAKIRFKFKIILQY